MTDEGASKTRRPVSSSMCNSGKQRFGRQHEARNVLPRGGKQTTPEHATDDKGGAQFPRPILSPYRNAWV